MSAASQDVGNAGPPFEVECEGRTYHATLIDDVKKTAFEKWLFKRHRDLEATVHEGGDQEKYQERLNQLNDQFLDGDFNLFSERGLKAMKKPFGVLRLVAIIFDINEVEAIKLLSKKSVEVLSLIQLIFKESFPTPTPPEQQTAEKNGGGPDPNVLTPAVHLLTPETLSLLGGKATAV